MKISIKMVEEQEDGSALCEMHMDREAQEFLCAEGLVRILREQLFESRVYIPRDEEDETDEIFR
jgi:hypothetical protein